MRFLDGIEPFAWPLADHPGLAVACGHVADHSEELRTEERDALVGMADVRAAEYSSGRRVAREALRALDLGDRPVTRRGRKPVWPRGTRGAIAHSREYAVAVVGRCRRFIGIGVDLELEHRVDGRIANRILNEQERAQLPDESWHTAVFSAKEAVYKAVNPAVGEFLEFQDVEITLDAGGFRAATTRPRASTRLIATGQGYVAHVHGHWWTAFVVPRLA